MKKILGILGGFFLTLTLFLNVIAFENNNLQDQNRMVFNFAVVANANIKACAVTGNFYDSEMKKSQNIDFCYDGEKALGIVCGLKTICFNNPNSSSPCQETNCVPTS